MTELNGNTVITMTMKQLIVGVVVLVGGIYGVITLTQGNLKSDIADLRTVVTDTQGLNANTQQSSVAADGELRKQIADLTAELKITNTGLTNLTQSMAGLDESVTVSRQEQFERWVVTSDLSDAEWALVEPLIPPGRRGYKAGCRLSELDHKLGEMMMILNLHRYAPRCKAS